MRAHRLRRLAIAVDGRLVTRHDQNSGHETAHEMMKLVLDPPSEVESEPLHVVVSSAALAGGADHDGTDRAMEAAVSA